VLQDGLAPAPNPGFHRSSLPICSNIPNKKTSNAEGQRKEVYCRAQAVIGKGKVTLQPIFFVEIFVLGLNRRKNQGRGEICIIMQQSQSPVCSIFQARWELM
jgi:hypothetical protein